MLPLFSGDIIILWILLRFYLKVFGVLFSSFFGEDSRVTSKWRLGSKRCHLGDQSFFFFGGGVIGFCFYGFSGEGVFSKGFWGVFLGDCLGLHPKLRR